MLGTIRKRTIMYLVSVYIRDLEKETRESVVYEDREQAMQVFNRRKEELVGRAYRRDDACDAYTWSEKSSITDGRESRIRCRLRYLDDSSNFTGDILFEEVELKFRRRGNEE